MTIKVDFNELLVEAKREPLQFDIGDGGPPLIIEFPTRAAAKLIDKARVDGDEDGMLLALFGVEQGERLNRFLETAPADLGGRLVTRVFKAFEIPGNSGASPT